jgi:hypothetical protein
VKSELPAYPLLLHLQADTITAAGCLALCFQYQGRFSEAEALHMEVLELRNRLLGPGRVTELYIMSHR